MALGFFSLKSILKSKPPETPRIFLYNTLTARKDSFHSIKSKEVKMYNCGPTVYGFQHIGNYRAYIFADILKRMFLYDGFTAKQVINITDVGHLTDDQDQGQDKVEESAKKERKTAKEITELYTTDFLENLEKLNIDTNGTIFPKATEHILDQVAFIKTLEEKGYTYKTADGIYFDTSLFKNYGKLGNINIEGLKEGARVEMNSERKHPTDFALWKFSKPEDKRQQEWDSPWGRGFPGWHIECSAMSMKYLGHAFDIHTGGIDHIPVHHNNEIAQSESATGKPFVNYWMHVAHLKIDGKKISKSLGNTVLISNLEEKGVSPLAYRYWLLIAHYRTPINFTWEAVEGAEKAYFRLQKAFVEQLGNKVGKINNSYKEKFSGAIFDDIDTPKALALVWELLKDDKVSKEDKKATLIDFDKVLGLGLAESQNALEEMLGSTAIDSSTLDQSVKAKIEEREIARKNKDWKKADELRDELNKIGYEIEDTESGPKVTRSST